MPHVSSKKSSGVYLREYAQHHNRWEICIRALPVSFFFPCDAPGISRYPHPEGEASIHVGYDVRSTDGLKKCHLYFAFELCQLIMKSPSLKEGRAGRNPGADHHTAPRSSIRTHAS